jgi:cellulose synthase/poly-beta-1,6-N-acetylglucosamine synthase-like glycosyltransferase
MVRNYADVPAQTSGILLATSCMLATVSGCIILDGTTSKAMTSKRYTQGNESGRSLVSVVIPTYNRRRQTIAAIETVLAQTYPHLEVIVVDDGSTDGSAKVIERFVSQRTNGCHRLLFLSQRNQGASVARNTGIAAAKGEYIAFLDSDDLWAPEKLEWQLKALERFKGECCACVTDARLINDAGMDLGSFEVHGRHYQQAIGIERSASKLIAHAFCGFWMSSLLARADTISKIGGFNPDISFVEDRDIHFRLSLVTSIAYVNKPLIRTDRTPTPPGMTWRPWDRQEVQFQQQQRMLESWLRIGAPLPPDVRSIVKRALGALHSQEANWHLENLRYPAARQAISKGVKYKATPARVIKCALTWFAPVLARNIAPKTRPIGSGGHAS